MKLVSFSRGGTESYGIVKGDGIVDVGIRETGVKDLSEALSDIDRLARHEAANTDHSLSDVRLLPPVPRSGRIMCVGLNYKSHIAETGRDTPQYPMLFPRYPDSLVGGGEPMLRPTVSEKFDFEGEMAFVIGRPGRHIPAERALDHVAGFASFNDGSLRDYQRHTTQFLPGKNFERSGSFGPYLVTADEVGNIADQSIETRLNGAVMQRATLDDLLFGVEELIAYMSAIWTLKPGDVVATGTTGGVGLFRDPQVWMKPGDLVEVEISKVGLLSNRIVQEA